MNKIDKFGINWELNREGFRTIEFGEINFSEPRILCLGDSHTFGAGNQQFDIWPEQLKAKINISQILNLGVPGISADHLSRNIEKYISRFSPIEIFVLWPDHSRFEYVDNLGNLCQSLPTDRNRIYFMETATEEWLINNFKNSQDKIRYFCKQENIKLRELSLYDLISIIDHADRWPPAANKTHFNHRWHNLIAEIFAFKYYCDNR
jgi:lysophospholipase L1-like esterase